MTQTNVPKRAKDRGLLYAKKRITRQYQLYLMLLLPVIFVAIYHYAPMYGAQIAFRDYTATGGITGSEWVGLKHFKRFLESPKLWALMGNTIRLSLYSLVLSFPMPIIMALGINAARGTRFKRFMQTSYYIPHFISVVVLIGIMRQITDPRFGAINVIIGTFGVEPINFMGSPKWFPFLYVISDIWQNAGYNSVIYIAALTSIDPELYDAASVDGASRWQKMLNIELPSIIPSVCLLLVLKTGDLINIGFEKIFLMQNSLNLTVSEVLSTYIYKIGVASESAFPNYSFGTAVGLFNAAVSLVLVVLVNQIIKRMGGNSLW